jgi:hypothetical protein
LAQKLVKVRFEGGKSNAIGGKGWIFVVVEIMGG